MDLNFEYKIFVTSSCKVIELEGVFLMNKIFYNRIRQITDSKYFTLLNFYHVWLENKFDPIFGEKRYKRLQKKYW